MSQLMNWFTCGVRSKNSRTEKPHTTALVLQMKP
jgi:hypothetical protein